MRLSVSEGVAYKTKQEFVYQALREAILRCELAPGQRLPTQEIAHRLGVSLIPVREALQLLQSEGLVENRPHVGAAVSEISGSSLAEVFTLLEGLETGAARVAARRMTSGEMDALEALLAEIDAAVEGGEYELWGKMNTRFHLSIARGAGMPVLLEMTERVFDLWSRVQRYYFKEVLIPRVLQAQQEHHDMLRVMRGGNEAELEQVIKLHNRNALEAYTKHLSSGSLRNQEESMMGDVGKMRKVGTRKA